MRKTLLFLVLSCIFLLTGCGSKEKHCLDPNTLAGMTKDEVLTQAFAKCPLGHNGELFLYVEETSQYGTKHFCGCEFKTLTEAKSAAVLKNSDTWRLDEIKVSRSSFPFSERELLVLHFTEGRVVEVGTVRISDM